jgi:FAD/FMN-containing dehydrogenase
MLPPPAVRGIYRTDSRARAAYAEAAGIYRIVPQAVCLPADIDDLRHLIRWAAEHRTALIPRGAGSAMGGGNVGEGVIVDLGQMGGRRLEIHASDRRATTSARVTLAELNAAAAAHGLRLPPDPSSERWASLGGMVSTNAAGARSVRYGSVRSWVQALTIVTADAEVVTLRRGKTHPQSAALARFDRDAAPAVVAAAPLIATRFPQTRKNSSGYALDAYLASRDVLDLVIGSEGTLGIVTEIEWRLDGQPACRAGLRVSLQSLDDLGPAVAALSSAEPSAVELLDRTFLEVVGSPALSGAQVRSDAEAVLLVELERDNDESLIEAVARAGSALRPFALSIERAISAEAADRLWAIRHAASPILSRLPEGQRSLQVIEDGCVPLARMGEYIRAVRRTAAESDIPAVMFGHAGDGHVHVNLLPDVSRPGWEAAIEQVMDAVTQTLVDLGGTLSGEHGDGRLRADALARVYGPEIVELFRRVKQGFDPLGIFNPGVILPSGAPPISRLKVGATAVPLPDDLQRALREIERTGGYGKCRLELAGGWKSGARS